MQQQGRDRGKIFILDSGKKDKAVKMKNVRKYGNYKIRLVNEGGQNGTQ